MRNWARLCLSLLCMSCALLSAAQTSSLTNLIFLESTDVKRPLERGQIAACEAQIVREMNLVGKELPNILIVHVSEKVGAVAGVKKPTLRRNAPKDNDGPPAYYELWLVGQVNPADYIVAFENLLEHHFEVKLTENRRTEVLTRIARYVKNTVSAYSGE